MSSMAFSAHSDTSCHGPLHLFKGARMVVNILTGIHNAMVECLWFLGLPTQVKIQRIKSGQDSP
jgi:hypothetical protein